MLQCFVCAPCIWYTIIMIIEFWILMGVLIVSGGVWLFFIIQERAWKDEKLKSWKIDETRSWNWLDRLEIIQAEAKQLKLELERVIIGQEGLIHGLIIWLFSGKHVLIQSLPGMAKTTAVKALAQISWLEFGRIQGTPDLLPSDIIWLELQSYNATMLQDTGALKHWNTEAIKRGPIFANVVLFDEINRTTPKVQSAFIQAMEEGQVTIGHETLDLPKPFIVYATCNPLGSKGVYDLPEAQLDRFGLSISLDYPKNEREIIINEQKPTEASRAELAIDFDLTRKHIQTVEASEEIIDYISWIIQKTRTMSESILVWCSPRAGKDLVWLAKTAAFLAWKKSVDQTDVDILIETVLSHRIVWKRGVSWSSFNKLIGN